MRANPPYHNSKKEFADACEAIPRDALAPIWIISLRAVLAGPTEAKPCQLKRTGGPQSNLSAYMMDGVMGLQSLNA
jgi:hypothetical protein